MLGETEIAYPYVQQWAVPHAELLPPAAELNELFPCRNEDDQIPFATLRRTLEMASAVVVPINKPLGDTISGLRLAFAAARTLPDKQFKLVVHNQSVRNYPFIDYPPNVTAVPDIPPDRLQDTEFVYFPDPIHPAALYGGITSIVPPLQLDELAQAEAWFRHQEHLGYVSGTLTINEADLLHQINDFTGTHPDFTGPPPVHPGALADVVRARLLGVPITYDDFNAPIVHSDPIPPDEAMFDILIAPDALEGFRPHTHPSQSIKSFTPEQWREIFTKTPKKLSYAVNIQPAHPDYCQLVAEEAAAAGLDVTRITTPTLAEFSDAVMHSRIFVGMDSGTTHLSAALSNASDGEFNVRSIHNAGYTHPDLWAPYGENCKTLVYYDDPYPLNGRASVVPPPGMVVDFFK